MWVISTSFLLLLFSRSVVSNSLQPHGLQHARLPCPSLSPRVYSNSCPLSRWCHNHLILCQPLLLLPSTFPSIRVFSNKSALHIRWPEYWSFSISPSSEYSDSVSFRTDFVVVRRIFSWCTWGLVLCPGIKPGFPALWACSLSHWTTREVFSRFRPRLRVRRYTALNKKMPKMKIA